MKNGKKANVTAQFTLHEDLRGVMLNIFIKTSSEKNHKGEFVHRDGVSTENAISNIPLVKVSARASKSTVKSILISLAS